MVSLSPVNLIPRVNSLNAIPLVFGPSSKIVNNVYHIIWKAMYTLASDPHPQIATSAQLVIDEIRARSLSVMSVESLRESKSNSSISESSSPNTGPTFSISESSLPITSTDFVDWCAKYFVDSESNYHCSASSVAANLSSTTAIPNQQQLPANHHPHLQTHHISTSSTSNTNNIYNHNNASNATTLPSSSNSTPPPQTNYTGSSLGSTTTSNPPPPIARSEDQQREWRMLRVMSYKNVCLRELQLLDPTRFNECVNNYKVPQLPQLMTAHPYDPILVFAGKHEFSIMHLEGTHANNYKTSEPLHHSQSNGYHHHHHNYHHYDSNHHHSSSSLISSTTNTTVGLLANVVAGATNITNHHTNNNTNNNFNHHHNHGHHFASPSLLSSGSSYNNGNNNTNHIGGDFHSNDLIGTQNNSPGTNQSSSHITSLQLINPQYNTLICTGCSDGSVRIWRAYNGIDYSFNPNLISAYNLMPELLPNRQGLGMILLWNQNQTKFYVTSDQNDVRIIKVWDANSESEVQDIPTCAEFGVSCLSSDSEHCIAAGFLDGSIRIYDTRLKKTDCRVSTFRKHSEKILGLHMFKPGEKHINLISGDSGGEVRFWDKRAPTSVKRLDVGQKMNVMTVHPNADVFAW